MVASRSEPQREHEIATTKNVHDNQIPPPFFPVSQIPISCLGGWGQNEWEAMLCSPNQQLLEST